jgi:ABC-type enterobactin transport system permease subunit
MIQLLEPVRNANATDKPARISGIIVRSVSPIALALPNIPGWLAAVWFGYAVSLPAFLHIPLSILFAALVGGIPPISQQE